jgi:hypothetical protein
MFPFRLTLSAFYIIEVFKHLDYLLNVRVALVALPPGTREVLSSDLGPKAAYSD